MERHLCTVLENLLPSHRRRPNWMMGFLIPAMAGPRYDGEGNEGKEMQFVFYQKSARCRQNFCGARNGGEGLEKESYV